MGFTPSTALVTDLETVLDAVPTDSPAGPVLWATVKIEYVLAGLTPVVTIRVPVPFDPDEADDRRRSSALRYARQLIDHACQAANALPAEPQKSSLANTIEKIAPAFEGIGQKLGLVEPTSRPKRRIQT